MAQSMAKTTPVMAPVAASKKVALRPATSRTAPKFTPVPQTGKMMVWQPINNKQFELFSYMPPFNVDEVVKQLDYIIRNGWTPCLEFAQPDEAYPTMIYGNRMGNGVCSGYYDNRYYTMWKLPMYGCTDPSQILRELAECEKCYPDAYIRLAAFDNIRQVQLVGFLLRRPPNATEYCPIDKRSISVDTPGKR